jgi:hypothetical protein
MRSLLVVVGPELAQDRHQVLLVQHNEVVETLSPQGCQSRVPQLRSRLARGPEWRWRRSDASGALTKVTAIDSVPIMQQMAWLVAPRVWPRSLAARPRPP